MLLIKGIEGIQKRYYNGWYVVSAAVNPQSSEWYDINLTIGKGWDALIRIHRIYSEDSFTYRCVVSLNRKEICSFNTGKSFLSNKGDFMVYCITELNKRFQ